MRDEVGTTLFLDHRDMKNTKSLEEVTLISMYPYHSDHHVMIGTELTTKLRDALVEFLKKNYDVFAWSQGEVLSIDPNVEVHKFFTDPNHPPIR